MGPPLHDAISIRPIRPDDMARIEPRLPEVYGSTGLDLATILRVINHYDPALSIVSEEKGSLSGFYLLALRTIPPVDPGYILLKDLKGIEGVALGVFSEYRGRGIGRKLMDYPAMLKGIDYIWGYQLKSLHNLDHWMKRRKLYFENDHLYITYQIIKI